MNLEAESSDKRILCVGLICLDIVTVCKQYPEEDSDQRSLDYYWQRGGNASNSSTVLALLGARVECLGTLVEGPEAQFLTSDLQKYGIVTDNCVRIPAGEGKPPVAICVISEATGSRTILAALSGYREVTFEDLDKLDLTKYRWIHFEGRPRNSIDRMMSKLHDYNESVSEIDDRITVSLELEKTTRPDLKCLMDKADVVFFSKDFAKMEGYTCKEDAVTGFAHNCRQGATAICAWGEDGAASKISSGDIVTSPVFPPENLCDTLGAGDTFNAATIFALSRGKTVKDAVTFGCRVAGAKCGMKGYSGIQGMQALLCGSVQLADN